MVLSEMVKNKIKVASPDKVAFHRDRLQQYLQNQKIFPASLELDISSQCNLQCPECPSSRSRSFWQLELPFIERLFKLLSGRTQGLLLTGGEPTLSPDFTRVLKLASQYGFREISVVTNGSFLDQPEIRQGLIDFATTIRISMYNWQSENCENRQVVLKKISDLRQKIDSADSRLKIGISVLTSAENASSIADFVDQIRTAGAHWLYFHPTCTNWSIGCPEQTDQNQVLKLIKINQGQNFNGLQIFTCIERYQDFKLSFSRYHAANFLLVVGADGKNYLGPEVKYNPNHVLWDLKNNWDDGFLWHTDRQQKISAITSCNYPALKSRHRGVLYNDFIENLLDQADQFKNFTLNTEFLFPHIL